MMADIKTDTKKDPRLKWVRRWSRLMDSAFTIPGTEVKIGLDPIISFIPGAGTLVTSIISGLLIRTMSKHGASRKLVIKMCINAFIDAVLGAIPLVGPIVDIFFRANERNVQLLEEHYTEGKHQGKGTGTLIIFFTCLLAVLAGIIYLLFQFLDFLF